MADNKQEINTDRVVDLATSAFYAAVGAADVVVTQAAKSYESMVSQARQRRERRLEHAAAMRDRMTDLPAAARGFPDQAREQFEDLARRGRDAVARARGEFSGAFGGSDQPAARPSAAEDPSAEEWPAQSPTATADPVDVPTGTESETDPTFSTPTTPRARRVEEDVVEPVPAEGPFDVAGAESPAPDAAETGDWIDEGATEVHQDPGAPGPVGTDWSAADASEADVERPDGH